LQSPSQKPERHGSNESRVHHVPIRCDRSSSCPLSFTSCQMIKRLRWRLHVC
jgi:hypothetical protein